MIPATWHHHSEPVELPDATTALIAFRDDEDGITLAGMYLWRDGQWLSEDLFKPPTTEYWWALESELVGGLPSATPSVSA